MYRINTILILAAALLVACGNDPQLLNVDPLAPNPGELEAWNERGGSDHRIALAHCKIVHIVDEISGTDRLRNAKQVRIDRRSGGVSIRGESLPAGKIDLIGLPIINGHHTVDRDGRSRVWRISR